MKEQSSDAENVTPYGAEWVNELIDEHPKMDPAYYNDNENKSSYTLLQSLGYALLKQLGFNSDMDPFFQNAARDAVGLINERLKTKHKGNKTLMRAEVLANKDVAARTVVDAYKVISAQMNRAYQIKNPIYLRDYPPAKAGLKK
jgi:hypothetical protein